MIRRFLAILSVSTFFLLSLNAQEKVGFGNGTLEVTPMNGHAVRIRYSEGLDQSFHT